MRPVVYISGPITNGDLEENCRNAEEVTFKLIQAGFSVICTHSHARNINAWTLTHEEWLNQDKELIRRSDVVFSLPGFSPGGDMERSWATMFSKPIYVNVDDLITDRALYELQEEQEEQEEPEN